MWEAGWVPVQVSGHKHSGLRQDETVAEAHDHRLPRQQPWHFAALASITGLLEALLQQQHLPALPAEVILHMKLPLLLNCLQIASVRDGTFLLYNS